MSGPILTLSELPALVEALADGGPLARRLLQTDTPLPYPLYGVAAGQLSRGGVVLDDGTLIFETTQGTLAHRGEHWFIEEHARVANHCRQKLQMTEQPLFFGCLYWSNNYQHFLTEVLPLLAVADAALHPAVGFVVKKQSFIAEIIKIMFPQRSCIPLADDESIHSTGGIVFLPPFQANLGPLQPFSLATLRAFRQQMLAAIARYPRDTNCFPRMYIARDTNFAYNAGNKRVLKNEGELVEGLRLVGFRATWFEDKSMLEKALTMSGRNSVVAQCGANLMNLLFMQEPFRLHIIEHPVFAGHMPWYMELLDGAGVPCVERYVYHDTYALHDYPRVENSPFWVVAGKVVAQIIENERQPVGQVGLTT